MSVKVSGCRDAAAPRPCSVLAHQPICCRIALFGMARNSLGWRMRAALAMPSDCRADGRGIAGVLDQSFHPGADGGEEIGREIGRRVNRILDRAGGWMIGLLGD